VTDPAYAAQVADIRRRGWKNAAIVTPFLIASIAAGIFVNRSIGAHLSASMYEPACRVACTKAGGKAVGHRPGGRGHAGEVRCACHPAKERWHDADLSRGSIGDAVLHYGGQEAAGFVAFALIALTGVVIGWRRAYAPPRA
jgi:hypothetical protein